MLQIAIGRRIFDTDDVLTDNEWLDFQSGVEEIVQSQGETLADTRAVGVSNFEGMAEETCLFVWFNTESVTQETRRKLAYVASAYRQYSIAITSGNTVFIKGA